MTRAPAAALLRYAGYVAVGAILVFVILPAIVVALTAFNDRAILAFPPQAWSLRWFGRAFDYADFRKGFWNGLTVTAWASVLALAVGAAFAVAIHRYDFAQKRVLETVLLSPLVIPHYTIGLGLLMLAAQIGAGRGFPLVILTHVILVLPFVIRSVLISLQNLDTRLERAAASLGASPLRVLTTVTLPLLAPGLVSGWLFAAILSFNEFTATLFVSSQATQTLPVAMYNYVREFADPTLAALSVIYIAITATLLTLANVCLGLGSSMLTRTDQSAATKQEARRPAVQLDGVIRRFGDTTVLHEAWLKVAPGEFMTLLGPSGCGKTTLLNLVAGFLAADEGEIFIDGSLVTATPAHRREIGFVFQNYALFPHMSVAGNIAYGLKTRGVEKAEIARRVDEALELVKLGGLANRMPRQLSGGQQQRVALARALVIRPKVLLLDEPLSALDRNLRGAMQVELKQIQRSLGVTTIFVTHDQGEALSMSDRIAVMAAGRIRQVATPGDIYRRPADRFVASFVGDVNFIPGRLAARRGDVAHVVIGDVAVDAPGADVAALSVGDGLDVFVRPENLTLVERGAPGSLPGTVAAQVFQGDHVDLHIDMNGFTNKRVLLRTPGVAALTAHPAGAEIGVLVSPVDIAVFPLEGEA